MAENMIVKLFQFASNSRRNAKAVSHNTELVVSSHRIVDVSTSQTSQHITDVETIATPSAPIDGTDSDIWSAAYGEAVRGFNAKVKNLSITGNKIADLLQGLKESSDNLNDSLFSRGLRSLKTPLENLKLALDITSPVAALDPTFATATATAAVKGVTAVNSPFYDVKVEKQFEELTVNELTYLDCGRYMWSRREITRPDC